MAAQHVLGAVFAVEALGDGYLAWVSASKCSGQAVLSARIGSPTFRHDRLQSLHNSLLNSARLTMREPNSYKPNVSLVSRCGCYNQVRRRESHRKG